MIVKITKEEKTRLVLQVRVGGTLLLKSYTLNIVSEAWLFPLKTHLFLEEIKTIQKRT